MDAQQSLLELPYKKKPIAQPYFVSKQFSQSCTYVDHPAEEHQN